MKKLTSCLAVVLYAAFSSSANAQSSATANANASANIIAPIKIEKLADMAFGTIVPSGSAGSIILAPSGGLGTAINVTALGTGSAGANFRVTGQSGYAYTVTLPSTPSTLTNGFVTSVLTVDTFTDDLTGTPVLTGGTQTFKVGGTLHVPISAAAALYTGSFAVTVNY